MFNIFKTYEVAVLIWHKSKSQNKGLFENASSVASVLTIWEEYKPSRVILCIEFWSGWYV